MKISGGTLQMCLVHPPGTAHELDSVQYLPWSWSLLLEVRTCMISSTTCLIVFGFSSSTCTTSQRLATIAILSIWCVFETIHNRLVGVPHCCISKCRLNWTWHCIAKLCWCAIKKLLTHLLRQGAAVPKLYN